MAYIALNVAAGLIAYHNGNVTAKALGYGLIVNTRFLAFFLVVWALALRTSRLEKRALRLVLWPSVLVVAFGLLQIFVLPNDILRHVGYGEHTIYPYETINHNAHYIRIISTLRGSNPLGTYLIVPITVLVTLLVRGKRLWWYWVLLAGALVVEYFSFSRSSWIGLGLAVIFLLALHLRKMPRSVLMMVGAGIIIVGFVGGLVVAQHSSQLQNVLFHTEDRSTIKVSSNKGHLEALKQGLRDVGHQPLGRGTGTAGPASVYNTGHPVRYAENYYLQIGQELGWLGMVLFIGITITVGFLLWQRRTNPMSIALLASLVGISFVCLLSHAWTDDTIAYVWWGIAGIAIAKPLSTTKKPISN